MPKRILLCGAPSSGKTTIVNALITKGYYCKPEISREIIKEAQNNGIENPFLEDPEGFDSKLLVRRIEQFELSVKELQHNYIFYDRGILDNVAYMNFGLNHIPKTFEEALITYPYDTIFLFEPWKKIHVLDKERYESFEIATKIDRAFKKVLNTYRLPYTTIPFDTVENRVIFILENLNHKYD